MAESTKIINGEFMVFLVICGVAFAFIVALTVYFTVRYHHRRNPVPTELHGDWRLELLWIVVPTLIFLAMFYIGLTGYLFEKKVPEGAMTVNVLAFQYGWTFTYENGRETDKLMIPAGRPVKLVLNSEDVIHSFYVPAFRIKQDAVPGLTTTTWFQDNEPGEFDVMCAEYCGTAHSGMNTKVVVMPAAEFESWYDEKKTAEGISAAD